MSTHRLPSTLAGLLIIATPFAINAAPKDVASFDRDLKKAESVHKQCVSKASTTSQRVRCKAKLNQNIRILDQTLTKWKSNKTITLGQWRTMRYQLKRTKNRAFAMYKATPTRKESKPQAAVSDMMAESTSGQSNAGHGRMGKMAPPKKRYARRVTTRSKSTKTLSRIYRPHPHRPPPKPIIRPMPVDPPPQGEPRFKNHGTNKMTEVSKERFSTFSADVDTGSYTFSRRKLVSGLMPPKDSVRVEEFLNYFTYDYDQPTKGPFAIEMEAAPSPFVAQKNRYVLRVGVQAKKLTAKTRKPVHLTFLVDVSGSMNRHDKLGLAKQSLKVLTNNLRKGDTVALATYASGAKIILPPTDVSKKAKIVEGIKNLRAGGSTNMSGGLTNAYKLALTNFKRNHVNRIIVLSDGDANVNGSDQKAIQKKIKTYVAEGVTLSTIGFGMGDYRDHLMEQLANKGNGNYYYIDTIAEAKKVFESQLDGTLQVVAKDVKLQLEFNPKVVKSYRLIGYENRKVAKKDFRNDEVDAGEVGAGHQVTALYEIITHTTPKGVVATMRVRHKKPDGYKATEVSTQMTSAVIRPSLAKATKDFQFATAVAAFAEKLRRSPYAKTLNYNLIAEVAKVGVGQKKQRKEFLALVKKAKALSGKKQ